MASSCNLYFVVNFKQIKIHMLLVNNFSSSLKCITILLQMIICLLLHQISGEECSCKEMIIMSDDVFVTFNHHFLSSLTSKLCS